MNNGLTLTYQARFYSSSQEDLILGECGSLLSGVERALYAEVAKGKTSASCKNAFLKRYGITARQFNACRVGLEGKLAACRAGQKRAIANLEQNLVGIDKQIQRLKKQSSKRFMLHQKQRRYQRLAHRLSELKRDQEQGRVRLCFGGKKLFRAQFYLEQNGFHSHKDWKAAWKAQRESEFFLLGSKDESSGNQSCKASIESEGSISLRLRLPRAFEEKYGKYLDILNLRFAYGHQAIISSLQAGQAISYRFKKDSKGWRVFVSCALTRPAQVTREHRGAIGLDLNSNHIALVETDRFGNPIDRRKLHWNSYGKNKEQLKAITGNLCKAIVSKAKETKKPLVIEQLNFQKKKLNLKENCKKYARLLSGFAYEQFSKYLIARAFKEGVEVHTVNPAFTSVIGCVNYALRYGLSVHLAAALCIARRHQQLSESPCSFRGRIPDGKGGHVAFDLPVRNRTKHVWSFWSQVKKKIQTVLAAHFRAMYSRSRGPLSPPPAIASS